MTVEYYYDGQSTEKNISYKKINKNSSPKIKNTSTNSVANRYIKMWHEPTAFNAHCNNVI